jgi:outer membrane protein OmpA-like peptidoglycan-associated protein
MHASTLTVVLGIASLLGAGACAGPSRGGSAGSATLTSAEIGGGYQPSSVALYEARRAPDPCGGKGPARIEFGYDSTEIQDAQELALARYAKCLAARAPERLRVVVVGHTDPNGPESYNLALGRERADRVKERLVAHGVPADHVLVISAGEADVPETQWDASRSVEVLVEHEPPPGARSSARPAR